VVAGLVAVIQLGIMTGAAAGGYVIDNFGIEVNYMSGSLISIAASLVSIMAFKQLRVFIGASINQ
jgi:predicted MFS family arabinose efflux permease